MGEMCGHNIQYGPVCFVFIFCHFFLSFFYYLLQIVSPVEILIVQNRDRLTTLFHT